MEIDLKDGHPVIGTFGTQTGTYGTNIGTQIQAQTANSVTS